MKIPEAIASVFAALDSKVAMVREMVAMDGRPVLCKGAGCNWCCYDVALISPVEGMLLIEAVVELPYETRKKIATAFRAWFEGHAEKDTFVGPISVDRIVSAKDAEEVTMLESRQWAQSILKNTPCPLLVDGKCSVYEVRPMPCRSHMVVGDDVERCKDRGNEIVMMPLALVEAISEMEQGGMRLFPLTSIPEQLRALAGDSVFDPGPE